MAKNDIDNLPEQTRKRTTGKAEQGIWLYYAPFGLQKVVTEGGKKIIAPDPDPDPDPDPNPNPDPDLAPIIRRVFEW